MRIVFMGTPDFAVPSLNALLALPRHSVAGVVTQPDRPAGRGLKVAASPVKRTAVERGLPVLQPQRLKSSRFHAALKTFEADLFVVVAFRLLPASVLTMPRLGAVNLHASLLPKYRGAAPIQWAIVEGEQETGVTTFIIDREMDAGQILLQRRVAIDPEETAGELHDRLSVIGAEVLVETVEQIAAGSARPSPQTGEPTRAPKLFRADGRIDWAQPAAEIHNRIRGFNPYPMAFTTWRGRAVRLLRSQIAAQEAPDTGPGEVVSVDRDEGMMIQTGKGWLKILTLQPEGRKPVSAGEFVRGYRIKPGDRLGADGPLPAGEEG